MRTFNWGILGLGRIARKFADDLRRLPQARLHAVGSTSIERARDFAAEYGVPHAFGSYEALAAFSELEVVYVATPHVQHAAAALLCLENGRAVLCEKPFAMHLGEARQMVDTARQSGLFLMEALWTRFIPGVVEVLRLAVEGAVGPIHTVKADFGFYLPPDPSSRLFDKALGGGALLDIGIYPALLALSVFGKPTPENVLAAARFTAAGVDESCAFTLRYPGGRLALAHATIAANTPVEAWLYGESGHIYLYPRWHHTTKIRLVQYVGREEKTEELDFPYEGWGYAYEAAHVMDCLAAGKTESDRTPLDFTLDLTETLDMIRQKIGLEY